MRIDMKKNSVKLAKPAERVTLVNRAGSVSEISPRNSFLCKKSRCVHMGRRAGLVTEISVTGMKIFPYKHSSPGKQDETFLTQKFRFRNISVKMEVFFALFVLQLQKYANWLY